MKLKEDQTRIKELLKDTITLLCKNGLHYKGGFSVEALIGITLDEEDVFLVNIKETIKNENAKSDGAGVDVTVQRRKTTDGSESEQESTPHKRDPHTPRSRKRPPDGSPLSHFDQPSPAKHSRMHSEPDSDASSTHYPSEQSKDSTFNIKAEPEDDELVFVKEEGVSDFSSSCAQSGQGPPFPIGTFRSHSQPGTPGHSIPPMAQGQMINPNFSFDSSQTGTTAAESLPGMSSWASSQPGALDSSGQPISAMSAQGSQQVNFQMDLSGSEENRSEEVARLTERHFPEKLPRNETRQLQARCRVCSKKKIRKETIYICRSCSSHPGLCPVPCFKLYHTKKNFSD